MLCALLHGQCDEVKEQEGQNRGIERFTRFNISYR
jgi:hypothetical protein